MKNHVSREHYSSSELPVGKYVGSFQSYQALLKIHVVVHISACQIFLKQNFYCKSFNNVNSDKRLKFREISYLIFINLLSLNVKTKAALSISKSL